MKRRDFMAGLAAGVCMPLAARAGEAATAAGALAPRAESEFAGPRASETEVLQTFGYTDVQLLPGPLAAQAARVRQFYTELPSDNLLRIFRVRAGLPAPGQDMGGWYAADGFAPAHMFGQVISALARFYANTGESPLRDKVRELVDGFTSAIAPDGFFYPCRRAAQAFPAYTYDKIAIGLLDAHRYAGQPGALEVAARITQTADNGYLPPRAIEQRPGLNDESYTLSENLYELFETTGEPRYRALAQRMEFTEFWNALAGGKNVLPGRHAYSHVNTLCSAARAYRVTGERHYFNTIENAWLMLRDTQRYASGGWGPNESFVEPGKGNLARMLAETTAHFETPCGSYADIKLSRYLLRFTGAARYGASLERVLYNGALGALDPDPDGRAYYYSSYAEGARKQYFTERPGNHGMSDVWPCCAGTLPQLTSDYPLNIYLWAPGTLAVNLYTPSALGWQVGAHEIRLTQTTAYPATPASSLRLALDSPRDFNLQLRVPENAAFTDVAINGRSAPVPAGAADWASFRRVWQPGDQIDIRFRFKLKFMPVDEQHPNLGAILYGPILLVALSEKALDLQGPLERALVEDAPLEFVAAGSRVRFVPWYRLGREVYTTYHTYNASPPERTA